MVLTQILVTGGTGLVGSAIAREAQNNHKYQILALSRSASSANDRPGLQYVKGNCLNQQDLKNALQTNLSVVHTVGTLIEQSKKGIEGSYERLNRDAAISVARAMAEQYDGKKRQCLVYFSAAKAPPSWLLDERYMRMKREAEAALMGQEFKNKIRVVVFRPGLMYSYHRRQLMLPFAFSLIVGAAILRPLSSYIPNQLQYLTDRPLLDNEVARATFEALENEEVEGIYEIDHIRELAKAWEKKQLAKSE
ncbi:uncharacterized protein BYT42DRAFT_558661 [Radiomyces spectabilis]|uniref:uncharacterized protein n=1 Tax=Radiomyces spectabilis TaxID=64574 RepID=UPI0022203B1A|nr:uncharacterized protein BYT42DRAFT_558661 [Radiomyces spectabilis]KAI8388020.1 hypothetical protein BYT42DRAFT_558661 [Radiomyces spectabilis]